MIFERRALFLCRKKTFEVKNVFKWRIYFEDRIEWKIEIKFFLRIIYMFSIWFDLIQELLLLFFILFFECLMSLWFQWMALSVKFSATEGIQTIFCQTITFIKKIFRQNITLKKNIIFIFVFTAERKYIHLLVKERPFLSEFIAQYFISRLSLLSESL